jgi:tetratricopeptide (TPR) repeat protein
LSLAPSPREAPKLLDSAEANLVAAVARNPANANAWNTLSAVYSQKDNTVQAKVAATRAFEADAYLTGTDKLLWRLYATSYDLEQFPDAVKYCDEGARRFPQNPSFVRCRLWLQTTRAVTPDPAAAWKDYDRLKELRAAELQQHEAEMVVAASLARAGAVDSARKVLLHARPDAKVDPNGSLVGVEAFIRTLLGTKQDTTEAFNLLSRFLSANPAHRAGYAESQSWWWKGLKRDHRFDELVAGAR